MAPHHCSYCLKPIATKPGIKRHIVQLPACHEHWERLIERIQFTTSNAEGDQLAEQTSNDAPDYTYKWDDGLVAPNAPFDIPEGHLVHQSHADIDLGPPDLCEPQAEHALPEEDDRDSPCWPKSGCFTEPYPGVAATILGKKKTVFERLESAELERGDNEWAPFCDKDEWELS